MVTPPRWTLRIGTDDEPGRPAADQIDEFARQVTAMSDGHIVIEPVWNADGPGHDDADQRVAHMVVSGELDMGVIPARAWDTDGVTSLRAMQAPFLITTNEMISQVVTSDLANDMLAGLDQEGVVGLALLPESLREVFSFGKPLLTPDEFSGMVVRSPKSDTTRMLFASLGATVGGFNGDSFSEGVEAGTIGAAESAFEVAGTLPRNATVTADLVIFPKVGTLVVNDAAFTALTGDQQELLRAAAQAIREKAVDALTAPSDSARKYCAGGGTVVVTGAGNLAAFRQAAEPVYAQLESDPSTKSFIDRIRDLTATSPGQAAITPCAPPATPTPTAASPTSDASVPFPEGIYRTEMSTQALLAAGIESGTANAADGINTLTFQDGAFLHEIKRDPPDQCRGTYTVESGRVVVRMSECAAGGRVLFSAAWSFDGTKLTLYDLHSDTDTDAFANALWGNRVWERIG